MKTRAVPLLFTVLLLLLAACQPALPTTPNPEPTMPAALSTETVATMHTAAPADPSTQMPAPTLAPIDEPALLQAAIDNLANAASFQMTAHEITSYQGTAPDGAITFIYGEFNTVYDYLRAPELKVHIQSQFRFDPNAGFTADEYYLFEQNGAAFMLTVDARGLSTVQETAGRQIDTLIGDAYQAVTQYGTQAQFTSRTAQEAVYTLDHPEWYTLQGAIGFADLGFLSSQENGAGLVKQYAAEVFPEVRPIRFILHVSIPDQVITRVEVDNRAFMQSVWESIRQALVVQGADPANLTEYGILPEHSAEFLFGSYNQIPDFSIPY